MGSGASNVNAESYVSNAKFTQVKIYTRNKSQYVCGIGLIEDRVETLLGEASDTYASERSEEPRGLGSIVKVEFRSGAVIDRLKLYFASGKTLEAGGMGGSGPKVHLLKPYSSFRFHSCLWWKERYLCPDFGLAPFDEEQSIQAKRSAMLNTPPGYTAGNVLIMGLTGVGKSTFIATIAALLDPNFAQSTIPAGRGEGRSTMGVNFYSLPTLNPVVTLMDTPGIDYSNEVNARTTLAALFEGVARGTPAARLVEGRADFDPTRCVSEAIMVLNAKALLSGGSVRRDMKNMVRFVVDLHRRVIESGTNTAHFPPIAIVLTHRDEVSQDEEFFSRELQCNSQVRLINAKYPDYEDKIALLEFFAGVKMRRVMNIDHA